MKQADIKAWLGKMHELGDVQWVVTLKSETMQLLMEIKQLRRKNSQLGGVAARLRKENEELKRHIAMKQQDWAERYGIKNTSKYLHRKED